MLVLSRQVGESIMIGDDIEIVIADIRGDKARVGINAPRSVDVHRKEIWQNIKDGTVRPAATPTPTTEASV